MGGFVSSRRLAAGVLVGAAACYLAVGLAARTAHDLVYDHRLLNIRKIKGAATENFVQAAVYFLRAHADPSKPTLVFLGSSVTFGYKFSDRVIFSRRVAEALPNATVLNLSVIGVTMPGIASATLCALSAAAVPIDTLFVEIPVINDASGAARGSRSPPVPCDRFDARPLFFTRDMGAGWLRVLYDHFRRNVRPVPLMLAPRPPDYIPTADAYAAAAAALSAARVDYLTRLKRHARLVVAFPSPIYADGLAMQGFDRRGIDRLMQDALRDCRAAGLVCLDTRIFSGRLDMFRDVAHLSLTGHALFARWLLTETAEATREIPPAATAHMQPAL